MSGISHASKAVAHRKALAAALVGLYDNVAAGEAPVAKPESDSPAGAKYTAAQPEEFWDVNITFRDPLMKVTGLEHYRAQFAKLHQVFPTITMQVYSITWGEGSGKLTATDDVVPKPHELPASGHLGLSGPGVTEEGVLVIDALCTYKLNRFISLAVRQITSAKINARGLIVHHEDCWSLADTIERIPLLGPTYRWLQPRLGALASNWFLWQFRRTAATTSTTGQSLATNTLHAAYHPIEAERIGKKALQPHALTGKKGANAGESKEL